jgi:hypothetical protein
MKPRELLGVTILGCENKFGGLLKVYVYGHHRTSQY